MKYLEHLQVLDDEILAEMCNNTRLASYPELGQRKTDILQAYRDYEAAVGSAPANNPMLSEALGDAMRSHYSTPPKKSALEGFINFVRNRMSPGVCPVCGAASSATVDHVYPKGPWPVFSFFSLNLVPACDQCNRKKNDKFSGTTPKERPVHPYFDAFLRDRVAIVKFNGPYSTPAIDIVPTPNVPADKLPIVNWHLENVVRKTQIRWTLTERWLNICRDPQAYYEGLKFGATVRDAVRSKLASFDSAHDTPNNWDSMLQAGVLHDRGAQKYLALRLAAPDENPR